MDGTGQGLNQTLRSFHAYDNPGQYLSHVTINYGMNLRTQANFYKPISIYRDSQSCDLNADLYVTGPQLINRGQGATYQLVVPPQCQTEVRTVTFVADDTRCQQSGIQNGNLYSGVFSSLPCTNVNSFLITVNVQGGSRDFVLQYPVRVVNDSSICTPEELLRLFISGPNQVNLGQSSQFSLSVPDCMKVQNFQAANISWVTEPGDGGSGSGENFQNQFPKAGWYKVHADIPATRYFSPHRVTKNVFVRALTPATTTTAPVTTTTAPVTTTTAVVTTTTLPVTTTTQTPITTTTAPVTTTTAVVTTTTRPVTTTTAVVTTTTQAPITYRWLEKNNWGACSGGVCGVGNGGQQTQSVVCVRTDNISIEVPDSNCAGQTRPSSTRPCTNTSSTCTCSAPQVPWQTSPGVFSCQTPVACQFRTVDSGGCYAPTAGACGPGAGRVNLVYQITQASQFGGSCSVTNGGSAGTRTCDLAACPPAPPTFSCNGLSSGALTVQCGQTLECSAVSTDADDLDGCNDYANPVCRARLQDDPNWTRSGSIYSYRWNNSYNTNSTPGDKTNIFWVRDSRLQASSKLTVVVKECQASCVSPQVRNPATNRCEDPPASPKWALNPTDIYRYTINGQMLFPDCSSMSFRPGGDCGPGNTCYSTATGSEGKLMYCALGNAAGVCGSARGTCTSGAPSVVLDRGSVFTWACGNYGGPAVECTEAKPAVSCTAPMTRDATTNTCICAAPNEMVNGVCTAPVYNSWCEVEPVTGLGVRFTNAWDMGVPDGFHRPGCYMDASASPTGMLQFYSTGAQVINRANNRLNVCQSGNSISGPARSGCVGVRFADPQMCPTSWGPSTSKCEVRSVCKTSRQVVSVVTDGRSDLRGTIQAASVGGQSVAQGAVSVTPGDTVVRWNQDWSGNQYNLTLFCENSTAGPQWRFVPGVSQDGWCSVEREVPDSDPRCAQGPIEPDLCDPLYEPNRPYLELE